MEDKDKQDLINILNALGWFYNVDMSDPENQKAFKELIEKAKLIINNN